MTDDSAFDHAFKAIHHGEVPWIEQAAQELLTLPEGVEAKVFCWDEAHGPYDYPDGCEAFVVFMGEGTQHEWDPAEHGAHERAWAAETAEGREGVEARKTVRRG